MRTKGTLVAALLALLPITAQADPIGTGQFLVQIGEIDGSTSGIIGFDNVNYPVGSGSVNLSTAGSVVFSGQLIPTSTKCLNTETSCTSNSECPAGVNCTVRSGDFVTTAISQACSGCDSSCNGCNGACPLCIQTQGDFVCPPQGCLSSFPSSFVGTSSVAIGTALAGLPIGYTFTFSTDGTTNFVSQDCSGPQCMDLHVGTLGVNVFPALDTPVGSPMILSTITTFFNSSTAQQVDVLTHITFETVSAPGTTTVTAVSNAAGSLPSGYAVDSGFCSVSGTGCVANNECPTGETCAGYHAAFFDISTTATYSGPITVCSTYPDVSPSDGIVDGTVLREGSLRILHRETPGGDFVDVTLPGYPNAQTNEICGRVNSLSPFVIAFADQVPGGGSPKTDCVSEWNAGSAITTNKKNIPTTKVVCKDNDPACDLDPTPGLCAINVELCPNQTDARLPLCAPTDIYNYFFIKPRYDTTDPYDFNNLIVLATSLSAIPGVGFNVGQQVEAHFLPSLTQNSCIPSAGPMYVPLKNGKTGKRVVKLRAQTSAGVKDTDKLVLLCTP